jgi:hypothetical protein
MRKKNEADMFQRILIIAFIFTLAAQSSGQELLEPVIPRIDTLQSVQPAGMEPQLTGQLFMPGSLQFFLNEPLKIESPTFDITPYLRSNWKVEAYQTNMLFPGPVLFNRTMWSASPMLHSATFFNQASYQIGDKITLGGNSFGVNSIFTPPRLHGSNQWETRGASMFMQYNVNKNFRIETRVSVSGSQHHP